MRSNLIKLSLMPFLALALALGACESVGGPDGMMGPEVASPSADWLEVGGDSDVRYRIVREDDAARGTATGIIGSGGGKLSLGGHELLVPAGAVSGPTTFTMTKLDDELQVRLTATQLTLNDVGSRGFAVPVRLVLNFARAKEEIADPSKLRIFWLKHDGSFETQSTQVDIVGKRAVGYLNHFSDYALVMP